MKYLEPEFGDGNGWLSLPFRSATNPKNKRGLRTAVRLSSLTALPHDGLHQAHREGDGSADERHRRRGRPVHVAADALSGAAHQRLLPAVRK